MTTKNPKSIVINASIARAAGDRTPEARRCREFLEEVQKLGHMVVMSATLNGEWKAHMSLFSSTWLTQMTSRRQRHIYPDQTIELVDLRLLIADSDDMQKDAHLLEAALQTDKIVASLDEQARRLFHQLFITNAETLTTIGEIMWINPNRDFPDDKSLREWLRQGGPLNDNFQLKTSRLTP